MGDYLGLDIGTTKIAALVLRVDPPAVLAVAQADHDTRIDSPESRVRGWSQWDADASVERAMSCIREALSRVRGGSGIAGVGVTGQMHGMAMVRPDGAVAGPFIGWQDQRGQEAVAPGGPTHVRRMIELAGPEAWLRTGGMPATGFMAATLFWLAQREPARIREARAQRQVACFLPDLIVARLTGEPAVTDPTNAGGSGVLDVAARRWDEAILESLGLPAELFPPIRPSGSIAGRVTTDRSGLPRGTPVRVGCGDNQASFAGSVPEPGASVLVNIGTGSQVSAWTDRFVRADGLETRCHLDAGYLLVGAELCGGTSYALLRDFFAEAGRSLLDARSDAAIYERLNALAAAAPPGCDGLRCTPLFSGTRAEPGLRAAFEGLSAANFTPGHLARAMLEGLAERLHRHYGAMHAGGVSARSVLVGSGNAVRKNPLLASILAERFAMRLVSPRHTEEAALGAALLAAAGGEFPSIHAAAQRVLA